jgi:hypothetical protein
VLLLVHKAHQTLAGWTHPHLGRLVSPRQFSRVVDTDQTMWWAADNDAYSDWNEDRYLRMLDAIRQTERRRLLFVTAPDVVADWHQTRDLWDWYVDFTEGLPRAYVIQDGQRPDMMPWEEMAALFVGGSTAYKLSAEAAELVAEAKRRNLWAHMGRVNTRRRIQYAKAIGCDSADGTQASMFTDTHLPWMLERAAAPTQGHLPWHPAMQPGVWG